MSDTPTLSLAQQLKDLHIPDQLKDVPQQLKDLSHEITAPSLPYPSLPSRRKRRGAARKLKDVLPTPAARRRRRGRAIGRGLLVSVGLTAAIAAAIAAYDKLTSSN